MAQPDPTGLLSQTGTAALAAMPGGEVAGDVLDVGDLAGLAVDTMRRNDISASVRPCLRVGCSQSRASNARPGL